MVVSSSRDKTIKIWNTVGECKHTIGNNMDSKSHTDWITCVRFLPRAKETTIISTAWDQSVKVWTVLNGTCIDEFRSDGSRCYNYVAFPPDGSLMAVGTKEGKVTIYDMSTNEKDKQINNFEVGCQINALTFSPVKFWIVIATDNGIKVWDIESGTFKLEILVSNMENDKKLKSPGCLSICWDNSGKTLYAGFTDGAIRVYELSD